MTRVHAASLIALVALLALSVTAAAGSYRRNLAASTPTTSTTSGYSNTALPVISGAARVGQTLTVSTGSWSPTPASFRYAWHRCKNGNCNLSPTSSDTNSYVVQSGDAGYALVAQVAPLGSWPQSVDSQLTDPVTAAASTAATVPPASSTTTTVPATTTTSTTTTPTTTPSQTTTTTTSAASDGTIYFDGRATGMTSLFSTSESNQGQSPSVWACLCFLNNDIKLVSDSRFGQVYSTTAGPGSQNPWWTPPAGIASAEVSVRRPIRLGQWDWYANSFKVLSGWTSADWATVDQMNYATITSPPLEIDFDKGGVGIERSVGYVPSVGGNPEIYDYQRFFPVSGVINKWVDFVIGVKWATDATGSIRVFTRCRECGDTDWVLRYSKDNLVTMQWGAGVMDKNGDDPSTGQPIQSLDKEGLYYGFTSPPATLPTDHILEMGLVRASDEATAMAAVP